jgi:hypothetical protein
MIRVPLAWLNWFTLRRSIAWIAIIGGGYALMVWRAYSRGGDPTGSVTMLSLFAPVVAFVLAPAIIGLFVGYVGWTRERTWEPWQGRYYAFDDHQIRIVEARGGLWFSSRDVHAALRLKARPGALRSLRGTERLCDDALGDTLSSEGLKALFGRSTDRRILRLLWWAEHDVRRPWQNRRDGVKADADAARHPIFPGGITGRVEP